MHGEKRVSYDPGTGGFRSDLIAAGMQPGKQIGEMLNELLERVLEDPGLNTKEQLLKNCDRKDF